MKTLLISVISLFIASGIFILVMDFFKNRKKTFLQSKTDYNNVTTSNTFMLAKEVVVMLCKMTPNRGTAKDLFIAINCSLNQIRLTREQLEESKNFLLNASNGSFIALFKENDEFLVYCAFKNNAKDQGVSILKLDDALTSKKFQKAYLVIKTAA